MNESPKKFVARKGLLSVDQSTSIMLVLPKTRRIKALGMNWVEIWNRVGRQIRRLTWPSCDRLSRLQGLQHLKNTLNLRLLTGIFLALPFAGTLFAQETPPPAGPQAYKKMNLEELMS